MTEQPRDWDKELADIDRAIEKQGGGVPAPRGGPPALPSGAPSAARPSPPPLAEAAKGSVALTWFWVGLAFLLALALALWPYGKECGLQLFFYLGATTLALLAGATGALSSWASRRGWAHLLALLVLVWAGVMAAREALPRVGYAAEAKAWLCPSTPEPAPPATRPEQQAPPAAQPQPAPPTS